MSRPLLSVVYRDEHFVAVCKPAGMFVHRTDLDRRVREVVVQAVRDQLRQPVFPVHRLDRPTSGVVLLGLSSEAAALASELFRSRQVTKQYLAIVRGHSADSGRINRPLTSPEVVQSEPLEAITEFSTAQRFEIPERSDRFPTTRCSLVRVIPRTGRFHQIRRHFNGINHPVIGDASHGDGRQNRFYRERYGYKRLMLHAAELSFQHPFTHTHLRIHCPLSTDMAKLVGMLTAHECESEPADK